MSIRENRRAFSVLTYPKVKTSIYYNHICKGNKEDSLTTDACFRSTLNKQISELSVPHSPPLLWDQEGHFNHHGNMGILHITCSLYRAERSHRIVSPGPSNNSVACVLTRTKRKKVKKRNENVTQTDVQGVLLSLSALRRHSICDPDRCTGCFIVSVGLETTQHMWPRPMYRVFYCLCRPWDDTACTNKLRGP
jgi:hypothetical protein